MNQTNQKLDDHNQNTHQIHESCTNKRVGGRPSAARPPVFWYIRDVFDVRVDEFYLIFDDFDLCLDYVDLLFDYVYLFQNEENQVMQLDENPLQLYHE